MKIMVTGGAGFIGSNVTDAYINAGHKVVVIDNLCSGKKENVNPAAIFYHEDVRSPEVSRIIEKEKIDLINHHAAQMSVPASVENPSNDADINILGLINLLESSIKNGVKKCIFISSGGAIYGDASQYPTTEDYLPIPLSPYAISKFTSEKYLYYYKHQYGLDFAILRYSNIYGPRQIPHGEAGVVAIFMSRLMKNKRSKLYYFPEDKDGMIRDYCYIKDVVDANLLALEYGNGDMINIGTGIGTKTRELYKIIYKVVKSARPDIADDLKILIEEQARPGDIPRSCLDVKKAKDLLGWVPKTGLKDGIHETLQWYLGQFP